MGERVCRRVMVPSPPCENRWADRPLLGTVETLRVVGASGNFSKDSRSLHWSRYYTRNPVEWVDSGRNPVTPGDISMATKLAGIFHPDSTRNPPEFRAESDYSRSTPVRND